MQWPNSTFKSQSALASYCRTGNRPELSGIKEENLSQYRRLVYNVVNDTLQSAFPLTHHLLTELEWDAMVNDFFSNHPCQSPQIWSMPKEFFYYLEEHSLPILEHYDFLLELIWFEWLEIEMYMMEDILQEYVKEGDIQKDRLVLNPEFHLQRFIYPVHLKNAKTISAEDKGNYFLALHREPESGKVVFTDLSPAFVRMLELLAERPLSLRELVLHTCRELGLDFTEEIYKLCLNFFENAIKSRLVLGFTNVIG